MLKKFENPYTPPTSYGDQGFDPVDSGFMANLPQPLDIAVPEDALRGAYIDPRGDKAPTGIMGQQTAIQQGITAYGQDVFTKPVAADPRAAAWSMAPQEGVPTMFPIMPQAPNPYAALASKGAEFGAGQALKSAFFQPVNRHNDLAGTLSQGLRYETGMGPGAGAGAIEGSKAAYEGLRLSYTAEAPALRIGTYGDQMRSELIGVENLQYGSEGGQAATTTDTSGGWKSAATTMGSMAVGTGTTMLTKTLMDKYLDTPEGFSSIASSTLGGAAGGAVAGAGGAAAAAGMTVAAYAAAAGIAAGMVGLAAVVAQKAISDFTGQDNNPPPVGELQTDIERKIRTTAQADLNIREWHDLLVNKGPEAAREYIANAAKGEWVTDEKLPDWAQGTFRWGNSEKTDAHAMAIFNEKGVWPGEHKYTVGARESDGRRVADPRHVKMLAAMQQFYESGNLSRRQFSEKFFGGGRDFNLFEEGGKDWVKEWKGSNLLSMKSSEVGWNPYRYLESRGFDIDWKNVDYDDEYFDWMREAKTFEEEEEDV